MKIINNFNYFSYFVFSAGFLILLQKYGNYYLQRSKIQQMIYDIQQYQNPGLPQNNEKQQQFIDYLYKKIKNRQSKEIVHLYGLKGIGKSTILKRVQNNLLKDKVQAVYIGFTKENVRELENIDDCFRLFYKLIGLNVKDLKETEKQFQQLLQYYKNNDQKLVVIIDSIEQLYNVQQKKNVQVSIEFLKFLKEQADKNTMKIVYCSDDQVLTKKMKEINNGMLIKMHNSQVNEYFVYKTINRLKKSKIDTNEVKTNDEQYMFDNISVQKYIQKVGLNYQQLHKYANSNDKLDEFIQKTISKKIKNMESVVNDNNSKLLYDICIHGNWQSGQLNSDEQKLISSNIIDETGKTLYWGQSVYKSSYEQLHHIRCKNIQDRQKILYEIG